MQNFKKIILIIGTFAILYCTSLPVYAATHQYDKLGRLVETTYDSGKTVTYTYDSLGNMTTVVSSSVEGILTGIEFDSVPETIKIGGTLDLTITANYSDGTSKVLDSGVAFSSSDELIATVDGTGKVTAIEEGEVTITADFGSFSATVKLTIIPASVALAPVITTSFGALSSGTVGVDYNAVITADNEPDSFEVTEGSLPDGLSLGNNGVISGVPATAGVYKFSVTASNASGTSDAVEFLIDIANVPIVPSIPVFTDGNGNVIDSLSSETINVAMTYTNTSDEAVSLLMLVAVYSPKGTMAHIGSVVKVVEPSQTETFEVRLYMPQNTDGSYALTGYTASVFLWNNNTLVPVLDEYNF